MELDKMWSKDPQHEAMKDGFTLKVTTNDEFYIKEGGAEKEYEVSGEGYVAFITVGGKTRLMAQGKASLLGIMRGLLGLYPAEEIKKALHDALFTKLLDDIMGMDFNNERKEGQ